MIKHGIEPILECNSKGDKRFSAFYAKVNGKSIEEQYQAYKIFEDGKSGLSVKEAKGKQATNMEECAAYYTSLWVQYFAENSNLMRVIDNYGGFSDIFGQQGHVCQATEIYNIWFARQLAIIKKNQNDFGHLVFNKAYCKDRDVIYCGRGSIWGNEFSHLESSQAKYVVKDRNEAVVFHRFKFIQELRGGDIDITKLIELADKKLLCYCAPQLCHCFVLAAAAKYYKEMNN